MARRGRPARPPRLAALLAGAMMLGCGSSAHALGTPAPWSAPAPLSACPAQGPVAAVFPSDSPSAATGAGAVVWSATSACPGGEGARVAPIGAGGLPGAGALPRSAAGRALGPDGSLVVSSAPHGQIVIAGSAPASSHLGLLVQGAAAGPFAPLALPAGLATAPLELVRAYLGDVGLVSAAGEGSAATKPRVGVERYFAGSFTRETPLASGPASSFSLALDYRTDVLVVWAAGGSIYARDIPARGPPHAAQRLAACGPHPTIATLLSDNNRAIVAWADDSEGHTSVFLDRSKTGVRFGSATLLERFADPPGTAAPAASPRLVRLSSESVMMAWSGAAAGLRVIRTAPIDLRGLGAVSTIATPGSDALLADLAPGPAGDAVVLWTEPQPGAGGAPDMARQAILAARGYDAYPGRAIFGSSEQVSAPAAVAGASLAVDPSNDEAIAVWRGQGALPEYSIRAGFPPP